MHASILFLYSSYDEEAATRVFREVNRANLGIRMLSASLESYSTLGEALQSSASPNDYLVILLSPAIVHSPLITQELEGLIGTYARQRSLTVVPVKIHPCRAPSFMRYWRIIDASKDAKKGIRSLIERIRIAPLIDLQELGPARLEELVESVLRAYGFVRVERSSSSGSDVEADIRAELLAKDPFGRQVREAWVVEVKASTRTTDTSTLRSFLANSSLRHAPAKLLFVTSSPMTSAAREWIDHYSRSPGTGVSVLDANDLKYLILAKPKLFRKFFAG